MKAGRIFFVGVPGYGDTKGGVLWLKHDDEPIFGPWFQPAFSVLMAPWAYLGPDGCVLLIAPVMTLLTGLVLGCLGVHLFRNRYAAPMILLLWLANPIVAWHGRLARAETAAVFFLFAGITLICMGHEKDSDEAVWDTLLGSLCLYISPFFHITAVYAVVPFSILFAGAALSGRGRYLVPIYTGMVAVCVFAYQTLHITDCYNLRRHLLRLLEQRVVVISVLSVGLFVVTVLALWFQRRRRLLPSDPEKPGAAVPEWLFKLAALLTTGAILLVGILRQENGSLSFLPGVLELYVRLTDFHGVAIVHSWWICLLGLVGWNLLFLDRDGRRGERAALLLLLLPGLMLLAWVNNYMLDTRRLMMFVVPLLVFSLAAVVFKVARVTPWRRVAGGVALGIILLSGLWGRTHLYTLVEHRGLVGFLRDYAEDVRNEDGMLLFEYTRLGAIFDHLFGVPTLSLNNEVKGSYENAEKDWLAIIQAKPRRTAFFATPFQPPQSAYLVFEPVRSGHYWGKQLRQTGKALPTDVRDSRFDLSLYRVHLRTPESRPKTLPYVYEMGPSQMGLRGFANMRPPKWLVSGIPLRLDESVILTVPDDATSGDLYLFTHAAENGAEPPRVAGSVRRWQSLRGGWQVLRLDRDAWKAGGEVHVAGGAGHVLQDVRVANDSGSYSILPRSDPRLRDLQLPEVRARWARGQAQFSLPSVDEGAFLMFAEAPRESGEVVTIRLAGAGEGVITQEVTAALATWTVWPAGFVGGDGRGLRMRTEPTWDPENKRYPTDLGLLVAWLVALE